MTMRTAVVCNSGHVRSQAVARMMHKRGVPSVAVGLTESLYPDDLLTPIFDWAERICICGADVAVMLLKRFGEHNRWADKIDIYYITIGLDDFKWSNEPILLAITRDLVQDDPMMPSSLHEWVAARRGEE